MKKHLLSTNGSGILKSQAERFLLAKHGRLENISRAEVNRLIHELQLHQIQVEMHKQKLLWTHKSITEARDRYAELYDFMPMGCLTLDPQGTITEINLTGAKMLRTEKSRLMNQPFYLCVAPEFRESWHRHFQTVFETGARQSCEVKLLPQDGPPFYATLESQRAPCTQGSALSCRTAMRDITERRQAEAALKQSERELSLKNRIAHIFLTTQDDAIYDAVLGVVLQALNSKCGIFGYLEENGALVVPSMTRHISAQCAFPQKDLVIPPEMCNDSLGSEAFRAGGPLPPCEPATLKQTSPQPHTIDRCLTVPLRCFDKVIAILMVANKETDYDDQDIRLLSMLADTIAPILNDRLQKDRQEKGRQWAEEALRLAAHKWRTTFDAIGDAVCLLDPDGRILQCNQAMSNLTGKSFDTILEHPCWKILHNANQPLEICPFLRMKQTHQREEAIIPLKNRWLKETVDPILDEAGTLIGGVHLTSDITIAKKAEADLQESEARFRAIFDQAAVGVALVETATGRFLKVNQKYCDIVGLTPEEMTATTCMAITHPDDIQAGLDNTKKLADGLVRSFTLEMRHCHKDGSPVWVNLTVSAMQELDEPSKYHIAVVEDITQRQQAETEVRQGLEKLHQALTGTVGALANTVETKDPYTAGHQRRVGQLACAIAREMGLPSDQIEGMQVLSFLHDIGKIAVPAEILSRPGKISQIEFNLIKSHTEVGYNILKDIEFPWPVAQAVLQHHERLDGSGYPAGLSDAAIIPEARILAVADVVEAMASHRPYRPSLGIAAALDEISKYKGRLFDAAAVDACLLLFSERNFTFL